ncbi:TonB-dependent receptor [Sphingobacterium sp. DK4209]|uniref:TonB-dependent receptor n=1 Tax=Sphingobacterium zhuxiongii TaxID=2662364 RepID=A0A5Q0QH01_9SPHI|nr:MULTISPECIES: TonB-dependent receptor [unclassified Sphingobacterium]MVZ64654.1 TonB-dependent receptor [Sphingobacterium sp. DK4209]QGA26992.1 TonB-dependent receptor [Sphingobacterium sp. dk4302]
MKAVRYFIAIGACVISLNVFSQHHAVQDTLKHVHIEEVLVTSQVGINKQLEREQRASKQANIDQLLDRISGIQMIRRGAYAWEPTIRSLNAAQISLSIDGMTIFGACTDRMDPISSYIEPSNLQQINVNLEPSFQNYGAGIAGGINFKLSTPELTPQPKISGMLGTGFETNAEAIQTLASLQYSTDRFGILVNGIFRKAQEYRAANLEKIQHSQFQKWNGSIGFRYKINDRNELSAQYLADYGQNIGYPALTMDVAYANANIASISHLYKLGKTATQIKSKIYFNHIDHAMDDTKRPAESVAMHMDMPGLSWTAGFYSETAVQSGIHAWQARVSGYVNRLTANMIMYPKQGSPMFMYTIPDAQRSNFSIDLSDKLAISEKWGLDLLGNYSFAQSSLYSAEGRTQLSGMKEGNLDRGNHLSNISVMGHFHPSAQWHWMAKVGFATRSASLQEYYGFYLFNRLDNYDYLGNVDLASEKSLQASLGTSYQLAWLRLEATAYNYFFKDYIAGAISNQFQAMTIGASGVKQYANLPSANLIGAEFAIRLKPLEQLEWISTFAYTEGKDNQNNALPLIAPFTNNNSLLWQHKGWAAQVDFAYYAEQNKVSTTIYGDTKTPSATLLNAGLRKTFQLRKQRLTSNIRIENIFDRHYYRHQDIMKIARPGRNFVAQINLSF